MSPLISVIIPTFNSEKYIKECIESVIKQTYSNWELIIVDDGSSDNTISIINSFKKEHNNLHFYKRTRVPKGANTCRNIGIHNSKGKYLIFLDSDDFLDSFCLAQRIKCMLSFPELHFGVFKTKLNMINGKIKIKSSLKTSDPLPNIIGLKHIWQTTGPIWKKSFLVKLNGFDEKYSRLQNIDLDFRALTFEGVKYKLFCEERADHIHKEGLKNLDSIFWGKASSSVELFLIQLINWLSISRRNNKYKMFLNRAAWNYLLYWWRSNSNKKIDFFIFFLKTNEVFSYRETIFIKIVLFLNELTFINYSVFRKFIDHMIRTVKHFREPNFNG